MKTCLTSMTLVLILLAGSACSVYKAATQPGPADLEGLGIGSRRAEIINRIGPPRFSDVDQQGRREDSFEFQSGFHQASKARIIPYMAADLFTLGLAELILWPMELTVMERATCKAFVTFDQTNKAETWQITQKDGVQGC
jgi:hypothetical protein